MKEYIVFFRGGNDQMENSTDWQKVENMQNWGSYMKGLAQNGNLVGGLPLQPSGRVMSNKGVAEDVVLSEEGEAIEGYLIIKANNYDQAVELSKGCPIFEYNGSLEIREMAPMEM